MGAETKELCAVITQGLDRLRAISSFQFSAPSPARDDRLEAEWAVAVKVGRLVEAPEGVWSFLDDGEPARASLLLHRAGSTYRELAAGGREIVPLVARQWAILERFPGLIDRATRATLGSAGCGHFALVTACGARALLAPRGAAEAGLLEEVLSLRMALVEGLPARGGEVAKVCCDMASAVRDTVGLVAAFFAEPAVGSVEALLEAMDGLATHAAPDEAAICDAVRVSVPRAELAGVLSRWLDGAVRSARAAVESLAGSLASVEGLAAVARAVAAVLSDPSTTQAYEAAMGAVGLLPARDLWGLVFSPPLQARAVAIVSASAAAVTWQPALDLALASPSNVVAHVWAAAPGASDPIDHPVADRAAALTPDVASVVSHLDAQLLALRAQVDSGCDCQLDGPALRGHLERALVSRLTGLCAELFAGREGPGAVLAARVAWRAASHSQGLPASLGAPEPLAKARALLAEAAARAISAWGLGLARGLWPPHRDAMEDPAAWGDEARVTRSWGEVSIASWDDAGTTKVGEQKSLLPSCASPALMAYLVSLSTELGRGLGHTADPAVAVSPCAGEALSLVIAAARQVSASSQPPLQQAALLQLLFDVRFSGAVLGGVLPLPQGHLASTATATALSNAVHSACSALEALVDPIDLAMFSPHLLHLVRRAYSSSQGLFPALTALHRLPPTAAQAPAPAGAVYRQAPSQLRLAPVAQRFALLPITASARHPSGAPDTPAQAAARTASREEKAQKTRSAGGGGFIESLGGGISNIFSQAVRLSEAKDV
jgi:hypothetical protein